MTPMWLQAGMWGLLSGSALVAGAVAGYFLKASPRLIAGVMAYGSGVLISVLSIDLMGEAYRTGGLVATAAGFLAGAIIYTFANRTINMFGARHRKRSGNQQSSETETRGSGLAIAVGALLDGIPESIAIGLSMIGGGTVSAAAVAGIFLSNIPEGMSSAAGMKKAGRDRRYIFGIWIAVAVLSGLAALTGYSVFRYFPPEVTAATTALAAGSILAMLANTMIPEAFEDAHDYSGLITVLGFLTAFLLTEITG